MTFFISLLLYFSSNAQQCIVPTATGSPCYNVNIECALMMDESFVAAYPSEQAARIAAEGAFFEAAQRLLTQSYDIELGLGFRLILMNSADEIGEDSWHNNSPGVWFKNIRENYWDKPEHQCKKFEVLFYFSTQTNQGGQTSITGNLCKDLQSPYKNTAACFINKDTDKGMAITVLHEFMHAMGINGHLEDYSNTDPRRCDTLCDYTIIDSNGNTTIGHSDLMCESPTNFKLSKCDISCLRKTFKDSHCECWARVYKYYAPNEVCDQNLSLSLMADNIHPVVGCTPEKECIEFTLQAYNPNSDPFTNYLRILIPESYINQLEFIIDPTYEFNTVVTSNNDIELRIMDGNVERLMTIDSAEFFELKFKIRYLGNTPINENPPILAYFGNILSSSAPKTTFYLKPYVVFEEAQAANNTYSLYQGLAKWPTTNPIYILDGTFEMDNSPTQGIFSYNFKDNKSILLGAGARLLITMNEVELENVTVEGCEQMWDAIEVANNSTLKINSNSYIKDGHTAIKLNSQASAIIENHNMFIDNNLSIYAPAGAEELVIIDNVFRGMNNLKPAFAGQFPVPDDLGFAAIQASGISNEIFAHNKIRQLKNGIVLFDTDIHVFSNNFNDIRKLILTQGYPFGTTDNNVSGIGVYTKGGSNNITESKFDEIHTGIRFRISSGDIKYNMITNSTRGIVTSGNAPELVDINGNSVYAKRLGISAVINKHEVKQNLVTIEAPSNPENGTGIHAGTFSSTSRVIDNTITMETGTDGIYLTHATGQKADKNTVTMKQDFQVGIHREGGAGGTLDCNSTSGPGTDGIYLMMTSAPTVACNSTQDSDVGIHLEGVAVGLADMNFKGNTIGDHSALGLHMGAGSVIGQQSHRGNIFLGSSATHDGGALGAAASPFFVDVTENPLFMPTVVIPAAWFLNLPFEGISYNCGGTLLCVDDNQDAPPGGEGEMAIARSQLDLGAFQEAGLWLAQRRLNEKILIEGNPQPNESDMATFISDSENNGLKGFAEIQVALHEMPIEAETVNQLLIQNTGLVAVYPYEITEKSINDILLRTVALDNLNFTSEQINTLEDIADRCPLSDGEAVLKARALLAIRDTELIFYNDESLCLGAENRSYKQSGVRASSNYLNIFPNPAKDKCTIEYNIVHQKTGVVHLYNALGVLVKSYNIEGERGRIDIDVSDLKEGTYWYHVPEAASRISSGNIVIQR